MRDRLRPPSAARPSRRQFLVGAASVSLLAACGDGGGDGSTAGGGSGDGSDDLLSVVRFYGPYFVAGALSRVPFGLADVDGLLPIDASPTEVTVSVAGPDGAAVGEPVTATRRSEGLPRPYYSFSFSPEAAGFYDFTVRADGVDVSSQVQVVAPDDEFVATFIGPGDAMPAVETPTVTDPRGVTPICTQRPPCDLHGVSVAEALGTGPLVVLVASPAFCQTAVCGPELEIMIDQMADYPEVTFVHAEVYADPANNSTPPVPEDFAPVVDALGLPFEPVLYTVGQDGIVRDRLGYIFDGEEINAAVGRLLG